MATTQQFYLIPAEGKRVRDPVTGQVLPAAGATKPRSAYWFRRLRDKDVSEGTPPAAAPAAAAPLSPQAQELAAAEAAIKSAETALESGAKATAQTTSTKGAAK